MPRDNGLDRMQIQPNEGEDFMDAVARAMAQENEQAQPPFQGHRIDYQEFLAVAANEDTPITRSLARPVMGEIVPAADYQKLADIKGEIIELYRVADFIIFRIVELVERIRTEALFRYDVDQSTGEPYRNFDIYLPHLLDELTVSAGVSKLSKRQFYEYMRAKRVFIDNMGVTEVEIMQRGVSHFVELAEALDYDSRTGVVSEIPTKPKKLGRADAEAMLETFRADPEWTLRQTREHLNELRGVVQRYYLRIEWQHGRLGGYTPTFILFDNGEQRGLPWTREQAEWVTKRCGAVSNLDIFGGD